MEENQKPWYQSTAIIGSIVTIIALVAGVFNYTIDSQMQEGIVELVTVVIGVIGSVVAIAGRIRASKTIK